MKEYNLRVAVPEWIRDKFVDELIRNALEEVEVYLLEVEEA